MPSSLISRDRFILPDARSLKLYHVPARSKCRGVVLFAHGMLEYAGRYCDWGEKIAERGYTFLAVDHRGHGRSDGEKIWMNRLDELVDDFELFALQAADEFAPTPVFLVGMSMGGGIAIRTAARIQARRKNIGGLILVAAALRAHPRLMPHLRPFAYLFDRFFPRWKLIKGGTRGLCHDSAVVAQFQADPLVHSGRFRVHYGVENIRALRKNRQLASEISLPLLVLQGEGDLIIAPGGAREFFASAKTADKTLKMYPDLYHDLLHEPEKETITADICGWLDGRCGGFSKNLSQNP